MKTSKITRILAILMFAGLASCTMKTDDYTIYTHGIWEVKPGMQQEFLDEWTSFAIWSNAEFSGSAPAYILADRNDSLRFVSFSAWSDDAEIQKWRETERFQEFVGRVQELCSGFQPYTLDLASTSK